MRAGARTHLKPSSSCSSFVRKMAGSRAADCCGGGAPGSAAAVARGGAGAPAAQVARWAAQHAAEQYGARHRGQR